MKTICAMLLVLATNVCFSQQPAFVVANVSGSVTIGNKKALFAMTVADNQKITLARGAKITLACNASGYATFSGPGKYIARAAEHCTSVSDPVLARLCGFAWERFSGNEEKQENAIVGAASRGLCPVTLNPRLREIVYAGGDFNLSWSAAAKGCKMVLNLRKHSGYAPFLSEPVTDTSYPLPQLKNKLQSPGSIYWNVAPEGEDGLDVYNIKIVTAQYRDSVVSSYATAISAITSDKAAQQYFLALLLEKNHFFADALVCYEKAANVDGGKTYSEEAKRFKKRYKM